MKERKEENKNKIRKNKKNYAQKRQKNIKPQIEMGKKKLLLYYGIELG